ncbi:MAG: hypothetical protein ACK2U5_11180 [Candidatus Promineifilaceae bacterium]
MIEQHGVVDIVAQRGEEVDQLLLVFKPADIIGGQRVIGEKVI